MISIALAQPHIRERNVLQHDAILAYIRQRTVEGLTPASISSITKCLTQLSSTLASRGVRLVSEITVMDIDAHFIGLAERGLALSSRYTHAAVVRACCTRWHADGLLQRNPALELPISNNEDIPLPELPLEPEEVAAMINAIPKRDVLDLRNRAIVEVLYGTALRLSECLHLDVDDIDKRRRTLEVRNGKGGISRTVPLMKCALGATMDYLSQRRHLVVGPDHGALFLNNRGQRIGAFVVQHLLTDLAKRAGLGRRVHPHLLRHSIAVSMLRGGAEIRHVQALLGHRSIETTKIYLRMVPGHLREEYDKAFPTIAVHSVIE
jgi:site-specific recombinase XerD